MSENLISLSTSAGATVAMLCASCLFTSNIYAHGEPDRTTKAVPSALNATLDEVLVSGEQPGPALWKISKEDHVLWIFGSYGPMPKKLTWRSKDVEAILSASQELLTPVDVKPKVGFFGALSMVPSLIGFRNNPEKQTLKEILPADLQARWLIQKAKYIGRDSNIEKWRPSFAASELYNAAVDQWGFKKPSFPLRDELREQIENLAKKYKVRVNTLVLNIEVEKPRAWVRDFKKLRLNDSACLAQRVTQVETDRELMRARANAWAIGDIAALRPPPNVEQSDACTDAFFEILNSTSARDHGLGDIPKKAVELWVAAAEAALAKNASTFAVLSIDEIFWPAGQVAKLRAKGYVVEEPGN